MKTTNKIIYLKQTCSFCPSQFEGKLDDGRCVYIRYRFGVLRAGVGKTINDCIDSDMYKDIVFDSGDEYDGCMNYKEVKKRLSHLFDFSECRPNLDPKRTPRKIRDNNAAWKRLFKPSRTLVKRRKSLFKK